MRTMRPTKTSWRRRSAWRPLGRRCSEPRRRGEQTLLGGSWVVISGVITRVTIVITYIRGLILITPLITTHEPPSRPETLNGSSFGAFGIRVEGLGF